MNILRMYPQHTPLTRWLTALLLSTWITACGTSESEDNEEQLSTAIPSIDVSTVKSLKAANTNRISSFNAGVVDIVETGTLNSTGSFSHPIASQEFTGNVTAAFEVADEQGISRVFLAFAQSSLELPICEQDCGTTFKAVVTGINPMLFELTSGEHLLQVWVEDAQGNLDRVDSVNINWQSRVINGVSATYDADNQTINVNWNALQGMLRYNVYLATDAALTGRNVLELVGGESRLALTDTNTSFTEKAAGNYFIVVTGVDGTGESAFSEQLVLINDLSQLPTANNLQFETQEDQVLTGNLLTTQQNDNQSLTLNTDVISAPSFGNVQLAEDGGFIYTPNANVFGTDQFSYELKNEAGLTAQAVVEITIVAVNDAPVALNDNYTLDADASSLTISAPGLLSNDTDIDGDALSVTATPVTAPAFGQLSLAADGSFVYTPNETFINIDTFSYQITDPSGATSSALVTILSEAFNGQIPVANNGMYTVNEDSLLQVTSDAGLNSLVSDSDNELSELSVSIVNGPQNGALTLISDGSFTYTPIANFSGTDSFTYQVQDPDGNSGTATITINVAPLNDAPIANDNYYLLSMNTTFTLSDAQGLLANDADIDGDALKVISINGTTIDFASDIEITTNSGSVKVSEFGGISYTPNANFEGTDSFNYQVTDGNLTSISALVEFSVNDGVFETDNNTPITIIEELKNDFIDIDLTDDDVSAEHGTLSISDNQLIYTPAPGFIGSDLVTINYTYTLGDEEVNVHLQHFVIVTGNNTVLGEHDLNANGSPDVQISINDAETEWTLYFYDSSDLILKQVNGRYYPIEPSLDGSTTATISSADSLAVHDFKLIQGDVYYELKISDLATAGTITKNLEATPLSTKIADLNFPAEFVSLVPLQFGDVTYHAATINNTYASGETYQFNADGSGRYVSQHEVESFQWQATDSVITVNDVDITSEHFTAEQLLAEGIIDDITYSNYIENDNDPYQELAIDVDDIVVEITVTDNKLAYVTINEKITTTYTLPQELGSNTITVVDDEHQLRLYNKATLGLAEFSPLTNEGKWLIPIPDLELDTYDNLVLSDAQFNDDNTGLLTRIDTDEVLNFSWAFDTQGRLSLNINNGIQLLNYHFFGQHSLGYYALVEGVDSDGNLQYSNSGMISYRNDVDMAEVETYLTSGLIVGLHTSQDPKNYDSDGYFTGQSFYGFSLSTTLADLTGNESIYNAETYSYYYDNYYDNGYYDSDVYWRSDDQQNITINRYLDSSGSLTLCDPELDSSCVEYMKRNWQVISFDKDNGLVWVIEDLKYIDYSNGYPYPLDSTNVEYFSVIASRLNAYQVLPANNLVDDTATVDEDATVVIDVLANDFNSQNLASGLQLIHAYSKNDGMTTINEDNTLTFTPNADFYGETKISYLAVDEFGAISVATVIVTVNPVNDAPVFPDYYQTEFEFEENTSDGYYLFSFYDLDPDGDAVTLYIKHQDDTLSTLSEDGAIAIDNTYLSVYINDSTVFDYESSNIYQFTLVMTDSHGASNEQLITINVLDDGITDAGNSAPLLFANITLTLPENQVGAAGFTATASDAEGDPYTITWSDDANVISSHFSDSNSTNEVLALEVINAFDYETLNSDYAMYDLDGDTSNNVFEYQFTVTVTQDDDDSLKTSQTVTLYINNIDENDAGSTDTPPQLAANITLTLPENQTGAAGYIASATDLEGDPFSIYWTEEASVISSHFNDSDTDLEVLNLQVVNAFDYEFLNSVHSSHDLDGDPNNGEFLYQFNVIARQLNDGAVFSSQVVTLTITDVDETPELTSADNYWFSENTLTNAPLFTAMANEPDNQTLSYSFDDSSGLFSIDPTTGVVSLNNTPLNYETSTAHTFTLTATDTSGNSNTHYITINVADVNEAPTFVSNTSAAIAENTPLNTSVFTVVASDPESTGISYALDDNSGIFAIEPTTGVISVNNTPLDHETTTSYQFNVIATDVSGLSAHQAFTFTITDVNEAPELLTKSPIAIAENTPLNSSLFIARAVDPENQALTYSFDDNTGVFSIDPNTGIISLANASLDAETTSSYSFNVTVTDTFGESDTQNITVNIANVNEAPAFVSDTAFFVAENIGLNNTLFTLEAVDPENQLLNYQFTTNTEVFALNPATGEVTLNNTVLDFENDAVVYNLNVSVTDIYGESDTQTITVNITDVNEVPVFTSASAFSVAENSANNTALFTVSATDPENQTIVYGMDAGSSLFDINPTTGEIILTSGSLDYETNQTYTLNITATDSLGEYASQQLTVNIDDINEVPTFVSGTFFTVAENVTANTSLFTVIAQDPESQNLTYSLAGDTNVFAINASSGEISVNNDQLDFETAPSYNLTVTATASTGESETQDISVAILNINEVPEFLTADEFQVAENTALNSAIFTIAANDPENLGVIYTLSDGSGLFAINSTTGEVVLNAGALDFEFNQVYNVTATATDATGLSDSQNITINVEDINEAPYFVITGDNVDFSETLTGSTGLIITAIDPENDPFTITVSDDNNLFNGVFSDSDPAADTYELNISNVIDYEGLNVNSSSYDLDGDLYNGVFTYQLTATVAQDDTPSLKQEHNFIVNVSDIVENTELVLDTSFGAQGVAHFSTNSDISNDDLLVDAIIDDNNNRWLLVQSIDSYNNKEIYSVAKLLQDGSFDLTFGHNGRKQIDPSAINDDNIADDSNYTSLTSLQLTKLKVALPTDKIYLLGAQVTNSNTTQNPIVIRLNSDGSLDNTFATDAKFVLDVDSEFGTTDDHSEAVDLLAIADGSSHKLYLASSSSEALQSEANSASFKLSVLDDFGEHITTDSSPLLYNLTSTSSDHEYIKGLVVRDNGDLVAFGHVFDGADSDLILSAITPTDLTTATVETINIDAPLLSSLDDIFASTYRQTNNNELLIGGSITTSLFQYEAAMVAKVDLSDLSLDESFASDSGIYFDSNLAGNVIDLAIDSNDQVTFITQQGLGSGQITLLPSQIKRTDGILLTLLDALSSIDLTGTSGTGISTTNNVQARILHETGDDNLIVFSNLEKTYNNSNSEIEIYYEKVDVNNLPTEFALEQNRIDYEFFSYGSSQVQDAIVHSSGQVFTSTYRYADLNNYDYGFTLTAHDLTTGQWQQSFGDGANKGFIHNNRDSQNNLDIGEMTFVELNDGNVLYLHHQFDNGSSELVVHKIDSNGVQLENFPVSTPLFNELSVRDVIYNANAGKVAILGTSNVEIGDSYAVFVDINDGSVFEFAPSELFGVDAMNNNAPYLNSFSSGVMLDDGSVIAVGNTSTDTGSAAFVLKIVEDINNMGVYMTDPSFGPETAEMSGYYAVTLTNHVMPNHLAQLSDGSLVFWGEDSDYFPNLYKIKTDVSPYQLDFSYTVDLNLYDLQNFYVYDMKVDNNDRVYLSGRYTDVNYNYYGFIARFNGLTGTADALLNSNGNTPGFWLPAELNSCNESATIIDVCDVGNFERINVTDDYSVLVHGVAPSLENHNHTVIIKFDEIANDAPDSVNMD